MSAPMSALRPHLERLEAWLRRDGTAPPWSAVHIVESADVTYGPVDVISRGALRSVEAYEARFRDLLDAGYAWINLNAFGVLDGALLVVVELPRAPARAVGPTSVNLSGPCLDVTTKAPAWDASTHVRLEEPGTPPQS